MVRPPREHRFQSAPSVAILVLLAAVRADANGWMTRWHVWFVSGRSFVATSVTPSPGDGSLLRIGLEGGGAIMVPAAQVRRMEQVQAPVSPVPEPAPEPAAAPPPLVADGADAGTCEPLADPQLTRWDGLARSSAQRNGLDVNLVRAVMAVESCGDPRAVSRRGAVGLMQLLPRTAAEYGCRDLTDPASNIEAGCQHLARLQGKMAGDLDLVLAAYNAGEAAVQRTGGVPRYRETRRYLKLVRRHLERLGGKPDEG